MQNLLQLGQFVLDLLAAMLAVDKVVDHAALDGAGTVECVESGEVFDRVWLIFTQHVAHPVRFKLEDARGQSLVEDLLVCFGVLERNLFERKRRALRLLDQLHRVRENRERSQAEEVHLQQAHLFDGDHVEGGHDFVVLSAVQRDKVGERPR